MLVDRHSDVSAGRVVKNSISDESFIKIHRPGVKKNRSVLSKLSEKEWIIWQFPVSESASRKAGQLGLPIHMFF